MRHFSSLGLASSGRVDVANRVMHDWHGPRLVWEAVRSADFAVEMSLTHLGNTMFSVHRSTGGRIFNRPGVAGVTPYCVIHAALSGSQDLEIDGHDVHLEQGAFTFASIGKSMMRAAGDNVVAATLHIPSDIVRRYINAPERLYGRVFPGHGLAGNVSGMMRSMLEMERSQSLSAVGGRLSLHLLDLFGLCSAALPVEEGKDRANDDRVHRIRSYVSSNIHEPELSVAAVAEHFGLSSRYIHMMFARDNDTLSSFIRHQRLERCRAELEDPAKRSRSISDLAFGWGFNDLSHFCRAFRRTYGVSARDYRKGALKNVAN